MDADRKIRLRNLTELAIEAILRHDERRLTAERALTAIETLGSEFSLFTLRERDGRVTVNVQDENCERKYSVTGVDLLDALSQAATAAATERAAIEAEHARLVADTEPVFSAARDSLPPEDSA